MQPIMSIDRITLVLKLMSASDVHTYLTIINSMHGEPGFKVWTKKGGYILAAKVPLGGSKALRINMGRTHGQKYVSFEFEPATLAQDEIDLLSAHFSSMPYMGEGQWLTTTSVSYIEIAVDYPNVSVKDVSPYVPTAKTSRWIPNSADPTPTQYLGARTSEWQLRIYDRNACLNAKGFEAASGKLLRVEASVRRTKLCPASLSQLPNPFKKVGLARLSDLPSISDSAVWKTFVSLCWEGGSSTAISHCGLTRAACLEFLNSCQCDWWDPAQIWTLYPAALAKVISIAQNDLYIQTVHKFGSTYSTDEGDDVYSLAALN